MTDLKKPRRVQTSSTLKVRQYASWLLLQVEVGNIPDNRAKTLNTILRTILKALETTELEDLQKRLAKLEEVKAELMGGAKVKEPEPDDPLNPKPEVHSIL